MNEISHPVRYRLLMTALPAAARSTNMKKSRGIIRGGDLAKAKVVTEAHILENLDRASEAFAAHAGS